MNTYEFDVILRELAEFTDEQVEDLFTNGCDDGTPASRNNQTWIHFDREAQSLEEAVRSAVAQVRSAGFLVAKIELNADSVGSAVAGVA